MGAPLLDSLLGHPPPSSAHAPPSGPVIDLQRLLRAIDRYQQRHRLLAFVAAVQKKAGDDQAGSLIANLAYSGFVALFPLLLLLVTVLGLIAGAHPGLAHSIERSALGEFPILGSEIRSNLHALHRASGLSFAIGIVGLAWGGSGLSQTAIYAMAQVWDVPGTERFGWFARLGRSFAFLGLVGATIVVAGFLSSFGIVGGRGGVISALAELASLALNTGGYFAAFVLLTPGSVPRRRHLPGALVGGFGWTVLQAAGGYLVERNLSHASAVYGFFGIVLGILAWLYLAGRLYLYAAEVNVVAAHRLWPRTLFGTARLDADRRALERQVQENARQRGEEISIAFSDEGAGAAPEPRARAPEHPPSPPAR